MPNWVSSVFILRPEDVEKILPFMNEDDAEKETGDILLDFNKIIPMPDTVYQGASGFGENWHPPECSSEEYRKKYPDGDWYKWSLANWGTKWNACHCSWNPPGEEDAYGILTIETAWSLPIPILETLHEDKKVDFQLYFVEESNAFFGAIPFTDDTTYPEYLDDEEGLKEPDRIFEMVKGESEFNWMQEDRFETLAFVITELKRALNAIESVERPVRPDQKDHSIAYAFLVIDELYIGDLIRLSKAVLDWKQSDKLTFSETVRALNDYVYPKGPWYSWVSGQCWDEDKLSNFLAMTKLREQIQAIRMMALNTSVGLTEARCNERLHEIICYEQLQMLSPVYQVPADLTIDSAKGKRLLFKQLLNNCTYEGLQFKIDKLIRQGVNDVANLERELQTNPHAERQMGFTQFENSTANNVIETATAVIELYDDIPNMDKIEFLRLMDVYVRTNLFQLDDENVKRIDKDQLAQLRNLNRRIGVINVKNMIQTGLVDSRYVTPIAAYIKTEKLGL